MKDLLDKISSYNIFNYLLPGIVFVVLAEKLTHYSFIQPDVLVGAFVYYFFGLVISRFGSLTIEPLLKWVSFVRFADYKDFVVASKKDEKIELLSEVNNTYRTLCSLFVLLLFLKLYERLSEAWSGLKEWDAIILVLLLLVVFLFSYRKQTSYITKRIKANE